MEPTLGTEMFRLIMLGFMIKYFCDFLFGIDWIKNIVKTDNYIFPGTNLKRPVVLLFSVLVCWVMDFHFVVDLLGLTPIFPVAGKWIDIALTSVFLSGGTSGVRDMIKTLGESKKVQAELKELKKNGTS